jgi:2-(1,2-epoxy-1,2-dihydrophenyl)acetyl-CoA isomerase
MTHFSPIMLAIKNLPVPIVTAVNGAAAGIGCAIALAGDMIVASDRAYFLQAFRRIALVPDGGSAFLLTRGAGRARTMEMMLMGEKLPAQKALEWGLVNRVVPHEELQSSALALAAELAAGPSSVLRMIRKMCWDSLDSSFDDQIAAERDLQRIAGRTADHREGITAFLEKRPAAFVGK